MMRRTELYQIWGNNVAGRGHSKANKMRVQEPWRGQGEGTGWEMRSGEGRGQVPAGLASHWGVWILFEDRWVATRGFEAEERHDLVWVSHSSLGTLVEKGVWEG